MEEKKKKFDKGTLIIIGITLIIVAICISIVLINNNSTNETSYANSTSKKENPYIISNQYDGTYSFKMESSTFSGYQYLTVGIISLDNGKCKARYIVQSESSTDEKKCQFEGFCGLNNNNEYFININESLYKYKCEKTENGLNCELQSYLDLSGITSSNLKLELLDKTENENTFYTKFVNDEKTKWKADIDQKRAEEKAQKEAEEKAQKEAEEQSFKESCQEYTFEQMARNPDNFKGTNVKVTGEVVQALYDSDSVDLRVNITKKGNYSTYYTDTVYVTYNTKAGEDKILEDDIITIYGTSMGDYSYTSTLGAKITLPLISAKYITLE